MQQDTNSNPPMFIEVSFSAYPRIWWSTHVLGNWTGETLFGINTLVNIWSLNDQAPLALRSTNPAHTENCDHVLDEEAENHRARIQKQGSECIKSPTIICTDLVPSSRVMTKTVCGDYIYGPGTDATAKFKCFPRQDMALNPIGQQEQTTFRICAASLSTMKPPPNVRQRIPSAFKNARADENQNWQQGHYITNIKIVYLGTYWNSNGGWENKISNANASQYRIAIESDARLINDGSFQPYHCFANEHGVLDVVVSNAPMSSAAGSLIPIYYDPRPPSSDRRPSNSFPMPKAPSFKPYTKCWETDWILPTAAQLALTDSDSELFYNACGGAVGEDVTLIYKYDINQFTLNASDTTDPPVTSLTNQFRCTYDIIDSDGEDVETTRTYSRTVEWRWIAGSSWFESDALIGRGEVCDGDEVQIGVGSNPFDAATIPHNAMWNRLNGRPFFANGSGATPYSTSISPAGRWFNVDGRSRVTLDASGLRPSPWAGGREGALFFTRSEYAVGIPAKWIELGILPSPFDNSSNANVQSIQVDWLEVTGTTQWWAQQETIHSYPYENLSASVAYSGALHVKIRTWQWDGTLAGKYSEWYKLSAPKIADLPGVTLTDIIDVETRIVNMTYSRVGEAVCYTKGSTEELTADLLDMPKIGTNQKGTKTVLKPSKPKSTVEPDNVFPKSDEGGYYPKPDYPKSESGSFPPTGGGDFFPPTSGDDFFPNDYCPPRPPGTVLNPNGTTDKSKTLKPKPPQ